MKYKRHLLAKITMAICSACIFLPILILAIWSVSEKWTWPELTPQILSLRAFRELFRNSSGAMEALGVSVLLGLTVSIISTVIGTMTARAVVFFDFPGKQWITFLAMLPILLPGTALAMGMHIIFLRLGLADTFIGVVIMQTILTLPYSVKLMADATEKLGCSYEEAALTLGAGRSCAFFYVSFPALLPGIFASFVLSYIISFGDYFSTLIIGGGNVRTFTIMMIPYIQSGDRTMASAYSMVYITIAILLFVILDFNIKDSRK